MQNTQRVRGYVLPTEIGRGIAYTYIHTYVIYRHITYIWESGGNRGGGLMRVIGHKVIFK